MTEDLAKIRPAGGTEDMATLRRLFRSYSDWLQVDLCFQGFEAELAGLPGDYVPPSGGLWLAEKWGRAIGCVALRPLAGVAGSAELKRLWVEAEGRGEHLGRRLTDTAETAARAAGYRRLALDTMPKMETARRLYQRLGFEEVPPPSGAPVPLIYMAKELT